MKQVVILEGQVRVLDVPAPVVSDGGILVRVEHSCVSSGTELAATRSAAEPLLRRALRQPEKVRRAVELARDRGLRYVIDKARGATRAVALGYSAAGTVIEVGNRVEYFATGDRVACAGTGVACHAEFIDVPVNLAAKVPDGLDTASASTVALGAIALQGVRRCSPQFGETIVVIGLGLLGQLSVQLLRASGCQVAGVDLDAQRIALARTGGMHVDLPVRDFGDRLRSLTDSHGADAVIVTAASADAGLVNAAIRACRRKGRVVIVGDVRLEIDRAEMYSREVDLLMATSYGPGRYDPSYEQEGNDYPIAYVRWTENRNMQAYLQALASGAISLDHLSRRETDIARAAEVYSGLAAEGPKPLLNLLRYEPAEPRARVELVSAPRAHGGTIRLALIGAGSFAQEIHLPNLDRLRNRFSIRTVLNRSGASARVVAERVGAEIATTDIDAVLTDDSVDAVLIATRHSVHADLALRALAAGKHVLVEKPLAVTYEQLSAIEDFYSGKSSAPILMTGFNRRFSPALVATYRALQARETPFIASYRMNAGAIAPNHWVHGPEGGGRNLGEACHIYDLFGFLAGTDPVAVHAEAISPSHHDQRRDENFVATVRYRDGSVGTLIYTALGTKAYAKERMDVFCDGLVITLDDYRRLDVIGAAASGWSAPVADKGHLAELVAFADGIRDGRWPLPLADQLAASRVALEVQSRLGLSTSAEAAR